VRRDLCRALRYRRADVTDAASVAAVVGELEGRAVFYVALPNTLFAATLHALAQAGLPTGSRIVIEKPFGADAADARALDEIIATVAGALRDMIQNHLLQLLSLVAMEPPTDFGERALRDRKVDVLRAVRSPSRQEIVDTSRRGRYTAGRTAGHEVPDYAGEPGVDPERRTETAAEVTLFVATPALRRGRGTRRAALRLGSGHALPRGQPQWS